MAWKCWYFRVCEGGSPKRTRNPLPNPTSSQKKGVWKNSWTCKGLQGVSRPFRKIPKGYRSARDKTLDQSQADKGESGNLGRQPETRKGIKLGGCLRKQGVGKRNQHTSSWFVAHEDAPSHDMPPPHTPGCVGAPYLHVTFSRRAARRPEP